jgi:2-polyprenyl-3-methyl-5-hydroxy-6-metoxy-1,4-benzoquinol methylase
VFQIDTIARPKNNRGMEKQSWQLDWTRDHIRKFWNWYSCQPKNEELYFSKMVGDSILKNFSRFHKLKGVAVDMGAGPGYLTESLLKKGMKVWAVDISNDSLASLKRKLGQNPNLVGTSLYQDGKSTLPSGCADVVFWIETIEHLGDLDLEITLKEIRRILKPDGALFITTPNDEDIKANQVFCPNCECVFHPVQHLRSFSVESLKELMHKFGFQTFACESTYFSNDSWPIKTAKRLVHQKRYNKLPHLFGLFAKSN